jgi:hypothetical protein
MSDSTLSSTKKSGRDEFRELSPGEVAALSAEDRSDYIHRLMIWSGNRYKGNPMLLLDENPHLDFSISERPHKQKKPA